MSRVSQIEMTIPPLQAGALRVAAYCRVSTASDEQLESLDAQRKHYEQFIKANHGYAFAGIYYDEGISGTGKDRREGLLRLLGDCENGMIDRIITKSISRFARNSVDCLEMVRRLLRLGVSVVFEKENIDTSQMDGEFLLSILSSIAQDESASISGNMKWGVQKRFRDGTYITSVPAYGYRNENSMMVIDETRAGTVRLIFRLCIEGLGAFAIAGRLNELNLKPAKGAGWSENSVAAILRNVCYRGDALFQKTYSDSSYRRHCNNGEKDQYLVEGHHEPIVSREVFGMAQASIESNRERRRIEKGSGKYRNRYAFSGRLICAECGSPLKRRIHDSGGRREIAWCCSGHLRNLSSCSLKFIRNEALEAAFTTMMEKLILDRGEILRVLIADLQKEHDSLMRDSAEDEIEGIRAKENKTGMLLSNGLIGSSVFVGESDYARRSMENLRRRNVMHAYQGKVAETSKLLKFLMSAQMHVSFDSQAFEAFVDHVSVCSRQSICFCLKCGLELMECIAVRDGRRRTECGPESIRHAASAELEPERSSGNPFRKSEYAYSLITIGKRRK